MSHTDDKGAEELQRIADEVERERQEKGHTPFDDTPDTDDEDTTREDHEADDAPLGDADDPTRAGAVGAAGRIRGPGVL